MAILKKKKKTCGENLSVEKLVQHRMLELEEIFHFTGGELRT